MRKTFFALAMVAALYASSPAVHAQAPSTAPSAAPAAAASTAPKHGGAQVDTGKRIKGVPAKISLSAPEKAKTDAILANASLKGKARADAIRNALTPEHLAQFNSLFSRGHGKGKSPAASSSGAPAPSGSPAPSK